MTQLIRIGNSRGVRIPKTIIEQAGLEGRQLDLVVVDAGLLISPVPAPRQGWAEAFQQMRAAGDDQPLLDDTAGNTFDTGEWEW